MRQASDVVKAAVGRLPAKEQPREEIAIVLRRQLGVGEAPGLVSIRVDTSRGSKPPAPIGSLTDAALRCRLAHFNQHSANEIAAVRQALRNAEGQVTVYETWPGLASCLQFWYKFAGSQIRPVEWVCDKCGESARENIGGNVDESLPRRCRCGEAKQLTVPR